MSDVYDLTANQREAWCERISPLFTKDKNCFSLAKRGGFSERDWKTVAGYIGEFRDGKARGLRRFFGDEAQLEKLAVALAASVAKLHTAWREVQESEVNGAGTLWLPGFEDWGPVSFDDGFVPPPFTTASGGPVPEALRAAVLARLDSGISVTGPSGSGLTTVLRRIATWAEADGWHITWGPTSRLPVGPASLLVLDGQYVGDVAALQQWAAAPGHALVRGSDGVAPWPVAGWDSPARASMTLRIRPVDVAWLDRFVETAVRLAPRSDRDSGGPPQTDPA